MGNNNKKKALERKNYSLTSLMLSEQTKVHGGSALCVPIQPGSTHSLFFLPLLLTAKKPRKGQPETTAVSLIP